MKYRNNVTNIGIYCGFATNEDGKLRVQQTACKEAGLVFELAEGARPAAHEYEAVIVIYQIIPSDSDPTQGGEPPRVIAHHVGKMPKSHIPKSFVWNSRAWPLNTPFYPFRKDKAGTIKDEILADLPETIEMPEWLALAAERDSELATLLAKRTSNRHLMNRLLVTGKLAKLRMERHSNGYLQDHVIVGLQQPGEQASLVLTLFFKKPGSSTFIKNDFGTGGIAATAVLKPYFRVIEHDDVTPQKIVFDIEMIDMLTVESTDFMPGAHDTALRRALGDA